MKVFITGGAGQVGFELQRQLCLHGEIMAPNRGELDLCDSDAVDTWLQNHQPQLIVNAAAYTAVDRAESEPDLAQQINVDLPAQLAKYAAEQNALLVHYSSDYVYPGDGDTLWKENSLTRPLSVYGRSKLEGDQAIAESGCDYLIFRTSWVYGARGNNFMKTMLRLGKERDALDIVSDQVGAPTPARLIAHITQMAIDRKIQQGVYHLAPRGETSWHGFACEIFRQSQELGAVLKISSDKIRGIPTRDYPTPAERPLNSRLNLNKLESALGCCFPTWQEQLSLTLGEYFSK